MNQDINAIPNPDGFWRTLRDAIKGTNNDFTTASIKRAVILLAVPMVMEMVLQSLFAITNLFWVTKLGGEAVAAVGLTEAVMSLVFAISMGLSVAAAAMVALRIGEKDTDAAATAAVQAMVLCAIVSVALAATGLLAGPHLLAWMGASPSIQSIGSGYMLISVAGSATMLMLGVLGAVFRGGGDAHLSVRVLWICNLTNLILDPLLIFGPGPLPELGVTGAAVATQLSRCVGIGVQVYLLLRGSGRVRILRHHLRLVPEIFLRQARVAGNGFIQFSVPVLAWIGTMRIVSQFGPTAIAASTIAMRVLMFFIFPSWGLNRAAATLVGQNLGAGQPDRAEQSVWITGRYSTIYLGVVGLLLIVCAEPIVRLFGSDPAVVAQSVSFLRILCCGNLAYGYGMVILQAYNGAGDTWTPTWVVLVCCGAIGLPLAWSMAIAFGIGANGPFIAHVLANIIVVMAAVYLFRNGSWKKAHI